MIKETITLIVLIFMLIKMEPNGDGIWILEWHFLSTKN